MPPGPSSERRSWWRGPLSLGTYLGMPFDLRREVYLLNGTIWALIFISAFLFVAYLVIGSGVSILPNIVGEVVAFGLLWIISRRRYQLAAVLLSLVLGSSVLYQSYFFRTGAHVYLLALIPAAAFLIRHALWRRSVGMALIAGFVALQAIQMAPQPDGAARPVRYLFNMGLAGLFSYGICSLFRQINDEYRRRLDERNRELQEANAAREKLFSILAHDLRGPIAELKSGLDLLDDGTITGQEFMEMKDDLKKGVDSVHGSLDNLLEWAAGQMRSIEPRPEQVWLREAFAEDLRLLERTALAKGIAVENRLPEEAAVRADLHQARAIFRNLVSNALKFTPVGGRVEVGAESVPLGPDRRWWRVAVLDSGVGMAPERSARLFDGHSLESTLGTAAEKGLGLGLQICRDFVRAHGGGIEVESMPGKGSIFRFTLPAWREEGAFSIPKADSRC